MDREKERLEDGKNRGEKQINGQNEQHEPNHMPLMRARLMDIVRDAEQERKIRENRSRVSQRQK